MFAAWTIDHLCANNAQPLSKCQRVKPVCCCSTQPVKMASPLLFSYFPIRQGFPGKESRSVGKPSYLTVSSRSAATASTSTGQGSASSRPLILPLSTKVRPSNLYPYQVSRHSIQYTSKRFLWKTLSVSSAPCQKMTISAGDRATGSISAASKNASKKRILLKIGLTKSKLPGQTHLRHSRMCKKSTL